MSFLRRLVNRILGTLWAWNDRLIYGVATRVPPVATDGTVTADIACRRCGYNLRGLPVEGRCPDCAMPVAASVRGDDLVYADPTWIAKLTLGAEGLIAGWVAAAVAIAVAFVFYPPTLAAGALATAGILGGTWLLTGPDAGGIGEPWYGRSRRGARLLIFLAIALPVVAGTLGTFPAALLASGVAGALRRALYSLGFIAGVAALLALLAFVRSLVATRARDSELARAVRRTFWEVALEMSAAGGLFGYVAWIRRESILIPRGDRPVSLATAAASLLLLWSLVQLIKLMLNVRSALRTQEMLARQFWPPPSRLAAPNVPPRQ